MMPVANIQQGGASVIQLFPQEQSHPPSPVASLWTAQCPYCAGALTIAGETVIAVNGTWLSLRKKQCGKCGYSIDTAEVPADLAINAFKGIGRHA